jgi:hypothetical protein
VIGLISKDSELAIAQEFFQLFKTPWESYVPGRFYELVLITTGDVPRDLNTSVLVIYDSKSVAFDSETSIVVQSMPEGQWLTFEDAEFPLYKSGAMFRSAGESFLRCRGGKEIVGFRESQALHRTVRVGYDIFQEVAFLLSQGQPSKNAHIPTLELHISVLRSIMMSAGVGFLEVLPAPAGYEFMACLTHDVDFTGIREHKFDSTMWGFLYRAVIGSLVGALKGTVPWSKLWTNWQAAFSLPLVYAGLKDDFWLEFDRYMEIEKELGSTFFFIPYKDNAGTRDSAPAPKRRAAKYDLLKIKDEVRGLVESGCEVGLHGVDAWQDSEKALIEREKICEITGQDEIGVRMHWLYFAGDSPKALEAAGFCYDSTFGYNDAIGFRAGTAQVFCIAPSKSFLELPLSIQDTALFYPDRMNLSETEAMDSCRSLLRQMVNFGGILTINWHTRSLSPERLWGEFYKMLLQEIQKHRVWFGTAQQVVNWSRSRRELRFEQVQIAGEELRLKMVGPAPDDLPAFVVRVHPSRSGAEIKCPFHAGVFRYFLERRS